MFKIESDVPFPSEDDRRSYPFHAMKVGDSFVADFSKAHSIRNAALSYGLKYGGKFSTRKEEGDKVRVWRVA